MPRINSLTVARIVVFTVIALLFARAAYAGSIAMILLVSLVGAVVYLPMRLRRSFSAASHGSEVAVLDGISRRDAMKRLGIGGAAAAIPLAGLPVLSGQSPASAMGEPARGPSGRIRQWGMIIDLRKCDGCQSQDTPPLCTLACIEGHLAPEPMEWIEIFESELAEGGTQFMPTPCQQCQSPPCVNVCPVGATFSTPEGVVAIDQQRCIGCRMCMAACPYDRRFFNWGDPALPPEALLADYSFDHQARAPKGTVLKCDFCPDLARAGSLPMCVQACPNDAIFYGDLEEDLATNGRDVVTFSDFISDSNSFRLKEDLGTQPRVYYIPGHGEDVGRDRHTKGRLPTKWPWLERVKGGVTWSR